MQTGIRFRGNLSHTCDQLAEYLATHGRLCNWLAVDDPRWGRVVGKCHLMRSGKPWKSMGMSEEETNDGGWRGTDEGDQIKFSSPHFTGTNTVGLSVIPGGRKHNHCVA